MNDQFNNKNTSFEEQEYLRMLNEETPDLWNRIETGIDAGYYQDDNSFFKPEEVKKKKGPRYGLIIPGIAAAAVVLFISVFAMTGGFGRKKNDAQYTGLSAFADVDETDNADIVMESAENNATAKQESPANETAKEDVIAENEPENQGSIRDALNEARKEDSKLISDIAGVVTTNSNLKDRADADTGKGTPRALRVGDAAPDFTVELYGGGTFHLSDYDDQIVVLDFWATWCGTCVYELPGFQKLENEKIDGVKILCVEQGDPDNEVEWVLKDGGYSLTVGLDRNLKASKYYPCQYIPYTLVIDHGVVAAIIEDYGPQEVYAACKKAIEECKK